MMEEIAAARAAVKFGSAVIAAVAALNVSAKEAPLGWDDATVGCEIWW